MWAKYKLFFHRAHRYQRRAVIAAGKVGYTVKVQNVYGSPPLSPEEHHEAIKYIQLIV